MTPRTQRLEIMLAFTPKRLTLALVGAGCIALAGCGGSDSSTTTGTTSTGGTTASGGSTTTTGGSPTTSPTTPSSGVLSGTAATGAALADASLKIYDATGAVVCEVKTGSDGAYSCDLGTSPKPPFVLVATLDDTRLVSIAPDATTGTVNITPLTNLIASTLSSNGDPQQLVDDGTKALLAHGVFVVGMRERGEQAAQAGAGISPGLFAVFVDGGKHDAAPAQVGGVAAGGFGVGGGAGLHHVFKIVGA
jgi:hypothetical protein